jgi:predicted nucleotidyltransferase
MTSLTQKEREILLVLFKDFTSFYNANSISKIVNISHVGAQKIFKKLFKEELVLSKKVGKSIIYKINNKNDYANQLISFLLADEANKFKRWKEEFRELFEKNRIVILYGSAVKNYSSAKDIDIMIITNEKDFKEINKILRKKEGTLPKKIHSFKLSPKDILSNIKDKIIINIIKNGVVLFGQDKYVGVLNDVTSF